MNVIIVNPFGIGDVLFTMPLVGAIRECFPNASIGYWCNRKVRELLVNNPKINLVFGLSRGDLKREPRIKGWGELFDLRRQIKSRHFDLAFDFSLDHRYTLLLRSAGIKKIYGFGYKKRGRFLSQKIEIQGFQDKHVAQYYLDTLRFLDIHPKTQSRIEVFSSAKDDAWAEEFLLKNNFSQKQLLIAICPAGGESWGDNGRYLRWPEDKFSGLGDKLVDKIGAKILLFGSAEETEIVNRVEASMKNKAINISGKLTLGQFVALLKKCSFAVCNDSGPLHIAVGLGVKTICLCGPVDERVYGPYPISGKNLVIKKELACRPCYKNFRFPGCSHGHQCLREISVDEAFAAAERLITS